MRIGAVVSIPIRDQVPLEMTSDAGPEVTAAKAEAVSWPAIRATATSAGSPHSAARLRSQRTDDLARGPDRPEEPVGNPQGRDDVGRPRSRDRVVELGGRGDRLLGGDLARQPVGHQVGEEEHRLGGVDRGRMFGGQELVGGVEGDGLAAGAPVPPVRTGNPPQRPLDHPRHAPVAVVERQPEEGAVAVEQPEVDAPGIDADALDSGSPAGGDRQRVEDLAEEARRVPVETVREGNRLVGEAMDLVEGDPLAVEAGEEGAARLGAEVDREI